METWRVGEVATATGLTVRALHHYDEIGLVTPSVRTGGGHRLYTGADLIKLYQVTAMRQLGLSLDQIGDLLAERVGVREVIDEQLGQVDKQIRTAVRLRKQLIAAREAIPGVSGFLEIIRLMQDMQGYLTPEQLAAMHRRLTELGVVAEHAIGVEMPRLYAEAQDEMRGGTPYSDPAIRRIVDRLDELSGMLRGGQNSETGQIVREMWLAKGRQQPDAFDSADWADLVAYLDRARAIRLAAAFSTF
jgi:MerR family transcriptional regulator, thiopeptide resistance regulator